VKPQRQLSQETRTGVGMNLVGHGRFILILQRSAALWARTSAVVQHPQRVAFLPIQMGGKERTISRG
jgi:hypothetical protein